MYDGVKAMIEREKELAPPPQKVEEQKPEPVEEVKEEVKEE